MAQKTTSGLPTIGDVIRAWREFNGLRPTELATLAGVRSQYLSEIEHNRTANPREEFLEKLAVPLKITLRDIYARQMPPEDGAAGTTPIQSQPAAQTTQPAPLQGLQTEVRRKRGLRFGAGFPVADEHTARSAEQYKVKLRDLLREIEEISRRIEELRNTLEQLLQAGEEPE